MWCRGVQFLEGQQSLTLPHSVPFQGNICTALFYLCICVVHSFTHLFMHACIHSFVRSFTHACMHAFVHQVYREAQCISSLGFSLINAERRTLFFSSCVVLHQGLQNPAQAANAVHIGVHVSQLNFASPDATQHRKISDLHEVLTTLCFCHANAATPVSMSCFACMHVAAFIKIVDWT